MKFSIIWIDSIFYFFISIYFLDQGLYKLFKDYTHCKARSDFLSVRTSVRTINHWNGLSNDIVNAPCPFIFKNKLDELWKHFCCLH